VPWPSILTLRLRMLVWRCMGAPRYLGFGNVAFGVPEARRAAERALHLDEHLAEAHTSLAEVLKDYDWDWPAAESGFRRAIALNPNYSTATTISPSCWSAAALRGSAAEIELARQVDPLSPAINAYVPYIYLAARDFTRAVAEGERAIELEPDSALAHWQFGRACLFSGDLDRAVSEWRSRRTPGRRSMWQATLGFARARAGDRCGAEAILLEMTALAQMRMCHLTILRCATRNRRARACNGLLGKGIQLACDEDNQHRRSRMESLHFEPRSRR
jgi:tetratricopeptide (TPR) repeat protein